MWHMLQSPANKQQRCRLPSRTSFSLVLLIVLAVTPTKTLGFQLLPSKCCRRRPCQSASPVVHQQEETWLSESTVSTRSSVICKSSTVESDQDLTTVGDGRGGFAVLERPEAAASSTVESAMQEQESLSLSLSAAVAGATQVTNPVTVMVDDSSWTTTPPKKEYQRGLLTIGFCTLVFASLSPAMHAALSTNSAMMPCPVVLLNAAVSLVALTSLVVAGPYLEALVPPPSTLLSRQRKQQQPSSTVATTETSPLAVVWDSVDVSTKAGLELGFWKFLGTVANLYGLSMTTADHGAFLIQLTTLIVPTVQGIMGIPIPQRIQWATALALAGVALFTQDMGGAMSATATENAISGTTRLWGDVLCVVAAGFYATYDLRLFAWGKQVAARPLITTKIAVQAMLSFLLLLLVDLPETASFLQQTSTLVLAGDGGTNNVMTLLVQLGAIVLWSGVMVNAMVPFLQVGGQQAIGATRAQTVYASQPLWASIMSFFFLGETVGTAGLVGGGAFLSALFLAATAQAPDPECEEKECEI